MLAMGTVLEFVVEAIIGVVVDGAGYELGVKLKGDPTRKAFRKALGAAIERYAVGDQLAFARPLLNRKSFLSDHSVAAELAKVVRFGESPNTDLIGKKWGAALDNHPTEHDFTQDARLFVKYFEEELRNTDTFRAAFEMRDLNALVSSVDKSGKSLSEIEDHLDGLIEILENRLGTLVEHFAQSPDPIRTNIRSFNTYIENKTREFVGRQWIFDLIEHFTRENLSGYFFILGDPGIGKTTLVAQMVKQNGYIHHFNIRAENINRPSAFLTNICAQLIAEYELEYTSLPSQAGEDTGFLNKLLEEVSEKIIQDKQRCLVIVDAVDEVDPIELSDHTNPLCLPTTLPKGIYFIVTSRSDRKYIPGVRCKWEELEMQHDSPDNLADITSYIQAHTYRERIRSYLQRQNLDVQTFTTIMVEKSEGNFMYLRYVLQEIENGAYTDLSIREIPATLRGYYEEHWQRMKGKDLDAWFAYKLRTIVGLTIAYESISAEQIALLTGLKRTQVREVLEEWIQFLHDEVFEFNGQRVTLYRLYHLSFLEFVASKEQVKDERVDLKAMHAQFADVMLKEMLGNG